MHAYIHREREYRERGRKGMVYREKTSERTRERESIPCRFTYIYILTYMHIEREDRERNRERERERECASLWLTCHVCMQVCGCPSRFSSPSG